MATITNKKEETMIGWVGRMYDDGRSPEHMAAALKQPIEKINRWLEIVKQKATN